MKCFEVLKEGNERESKTDGASFRFSIEATFERLHDIFGKPTYTNEGNYWDSYECGTKTRAEWVILLEDGTAITVYDWKEYLPIEETIKWHVGGFEKDEGKIKQFLKKQKLKIGE